MFDWFRQRRRKKLTEVPFPVAWVEIITRNVAHYSMLEDAERVHLHALIQVFLAEKYWEGAGDLQLDDEIRVTVSAQGPSATTTSLASSGPSGVAMRQPSPSSTCSMVAASPDFNSPPRDWK